jgi:hypothetical protein
MHARRGGRLSQRRAGFAGGQGLLGPFLTELPSSLLAPLCHFDFV